VAKNEALALEISSDPSGHHIVVKGTLPIDQRDIVRTSPILDPKHFAQTAFIQALQNQGIKINSPKQAAAQTTFPNSYQNDQRVALWTSPPLTEYVKLILKVSHNLGADLVPLLLASKQGKKTFDEGMRLLGDFAIKQIKLSPDSFVFVDAAGGDENRLTPQAEVQLLELMHQKSPVQFRNYFDALPILGVDGSLEDFAKNTPAAGKVRAKPGTGVSLNLATGNYFLITQALAGYIEGKNGHLLAYMVAVNNSKISSINDIFIVFEDQGQLSNIIYNLSDSD
jgi:serine-type D-Ala-D-Ala carboxypeptidase/endopeptidase (penicillin-binding protein 4)